jgi:hypothetical protein
MRVHIVSICNLLERDHCFPPFSGRQNPDSTSTAAFQTELFISDGTRLDEAVDGALGVQDFAADFYVSKGISAMGAPDCESLRLDVEFFSGFFC